MIKFSENTQFRPLLAFLIVACFCTVTRSGVGSSSGTPLLLFVAADDNDEEGIIHDDNSLLSANEILLKVYDETRGLRWDQNTNWLQNTDVCSWHGVTCYDSSTSDQRRVGHVQRLDLSGNSLLGTLPKECFLLPYLESIDLRDNADLSINFSGVRDAQYLKEVAISNTNVKSLEGLEEARQLETIHMTSLGLTGSIPPQLYQLTNLVGVYANYNKFSGALSSQIGQLKYLTDLYLFDSDLTGQIPSEIGLLSNLEVLTLAENAFGGTLPTEINKCSKLTTLAINRAPGLEKGVGISGPLPSLSSLRDMSDLRLQNQLLSGPIPTDFLSSAPRQDLVKVELSGNSLTGALPSSLKSLKRLNLFLGGNQISSLADDYCDESIDMWMGGNVGTIGCDALLCPPGTVASQGRATNDEPCLSCRGAEYWGSTRCASSTTTTSMGYSEREVLINLYNKMGGRYWKNDFGWLNPAEDICDWYGVECYDGKVTGLLMKNNDLSNSPPMELFSLPELKHIDFGSNSIDFTFKGIGSAVNLETLLLQSCDLGSLDHIGELASTPIRKLSLASNYLDGNIPADIFQLVGLEELDISHNRFVGELPTQVGSLINLESLSFSKNKLSGQIPTNLGLLEKLRQLEGSDNDFTGTLPSELNMLSRLQVLSLHQTTSSKGIGGRLPAFPNLGQLTSLQLDSNNISGNLPSDLLRNTMKGDMEIEISLSDNKLQGDVPGSWASRFERLFLDLSGNRITAVGKTLCDQVEWNGGNVKSFACDAILCPPGKFNEFGRQTGPQTTCRDCSHQNSAQYFGSKECNDAENSIAQETAELGIMKDFFYSTSGNNWKHNAGWMTSNDPCDNWYGIECDSSGKISSIKLESNGLAGTPSSAIFRLSSLRTVNLKDNRISFSFEGISQASNLQVLDLSSTNLDSLDGMLEGGTLKSTLKELYLTDNDLKGTFPDAITQLTNLEKLYMNYNSLSGKIPPGISALSKIEELMLFNNRFIGQIPASIGLLSNLRLLSLAECSFSGTLPPELNDLTSLELLSIQREGGTEESNVGINQGINDDLGAGIGGALPALDNLKALRKLYLGVNNLTGKIPYNFLNGIENKALSIQIDLMSNRLTGSVPGSLSEFSDLSLYLAGNKIDGIAEGLCRKNEWMKGAVAMYQCDAILCPPGTSNPNGRQTNNSSSCSACSLASAAEFYGSFTCLDEEDQQASSERAILEALFRATEGNGWKSKSMWLDSGESICSWHGISCVDGMESVASISLSDNGLRGTIPTEIFDLPNIKDIVLSQNTIDMTFDGIGGASKLEYLELDATNVRSLSGVGVAVNLKVLHFANNLLANQQFPNEVLSLSNLESLDLSGISVGVLPSLAGLSNLKYLACSTCDISGTFPSWITSLTKLEHVELDGNYFAGELPSLLSSLSDLKYFDVADQVSNGGNGLSGSLPDFSGMKQLQFLYLERNSLGGSIPGTFLKDVTVDGTVTVDLRANNLTGPIPAELARISDLHINVGSNMIDSIPENVCVASWNDKEDSTSGCDHILCGKGTFNALGHATQTMPCVPCTEPGYAQYFGSTECGPGFEKNIVYGLFESLGGRNWIHTDGWQEHDNACSWYGVTCYSGGFRDGHVQKIDLSDNNLQGTLDVPIWQLVHMKELDLRKNEIVVSFDGIANAQALETLQLSETMLSTMEGISAAPNMQYLHLTNCQIEGAIPDELYEMTQLKGLYLNFNELTGTLSDDIGMLSQLKEMYLFHNALNGTIPSEIGLLESVEILSLGENKFTGPIPVEMNSLENLRVLALQREKAEFDPNQFFTVVQDVGLTGEIIPFNNTPNLRELYLSDNHLQGGLPNDFLLGIDDTSSTIRVDLSSNMFHGDIPVSLVRFDDLRLDLTGNSLRSIPEELCSRTEWFDGEMSSGCDAFLCPPGTYNEYGRRVGNEECQTCNFRGAAMFYGTRSCGALFPQGMSDNLMLQEIFASTGGLSWENSDNWLREDASICDWYGVSCTVINDQEYVTELDLSNNGLQGLVPSIVFYLPVLKKLNLGGNKIWVNFDDIQYSVLEELYLDETNVASLDGISKLPTLKTVHLQRSQMHGRSIPEEFYMLPNITVADLSQCGLSGTLSTSIGQMRSLVSLLVDRNDLSGEIPNSIGMLTNLQDLFMSDNNFWGTLPSSVNQLTSLTSLFLDAYNRNTAGITGPLLSFSSMPKLRELHIGSNSLTGTIPSNLLSGITDMAAIVNVDLGSNHLTGGIPSELSAFENLNLYVTDNYISGIGSGLCAKPAWVEGFVGSFGCSGLLCPVGTYNSDGRQSSDDEPCLPCNGDFVPPYMGQVSCLTEEKEKERQILQLFFEATGGKIWKNKDGWLESDDVCDWYGITCNDGRVESITLGGNNLVGTPPEEIYDLNYLQTLWLYSNPIDFNFVGIGRATKLQSLRLDSTGLKSISGLGDATSLVEVDIRFNRLTGEIPDLSGLKQLETFSCSANKLNGSLPSFASNQKLISLRVAGNEFSGLLPSFSDHPAMHTLDVSSNDLSGSIPQDLLAASDPSASVFLDLSSNLFTGSVPSTFSRFTDLTLFLRDNRIDDLEQSLCTQKDWNQGDVALAGCDGILCPPKTYSPVTGRASRGGSKCLRCDAVQYFGSTTCGGGSGAPIYGHYVGTLLALFPFVWFYFI